MTAFSIPFTLVTPPADQVNPKFLFLTGRTEGLIHSSIASSFNRFENSVNAALKAFNTSQAKANADPTVNISNLESKLEKAFNRLSTDLLKVSRMVSYGGVNLNPVLQNRIIGSAGVTDTTSQVNTPSLQTTLTNTLVTDGTSNNAQVKQEIQTTRSLVSADVKNYVNLGVTNDYFRLTRGATFPALS